MLTVSVVTIVAVLGLTSSPPAGAAARVHATASWSMVPLTKDVDGDGIVDGDGGVPASGALSRTPSATMVGAGNRVAQPHERLIDGALSWYLPRSGFPVRLDACASEGDAYRWRIAPSTGAGIRTAWRSLERGQCRTVVSLPEGPAVATLEVRAGGVVDRTAVPLDVSNLLVLVLGDSYASGEGNPRNVMSWIRKGGSIDPYWDDDACNRSGRAAPAQAALSLEKASPRTSVSLVHLACSGATVAAGLLGPQTGAGQRSSQLEQAAAVLAGRPVDLVLLSVGGNDVGFGTILRTCALDADCATSLNPGVQSRTGALAPAFARIAACLGGPVCTLADGRTLPGIAMSPNARVLPLLYPDITRASDGSACTYLSIPARDFAWARSTVLDPDPPTSYPYPTSSGATAVLPVSGSLNQQVAATAALPGWSPVLGSWTASGTTPAGHGVCAGDQAWVFGFTGLTGLTEASFHPNPTGQSVIADAIVQAIKSLPSQARRT